MRWFTALHDQREAARPVVIAILNDLLDSGEATKLEEVLIDFDAVKIPSIRHEVEPLEARLKNALEFCFLRHLPFGSIGQL